MTSFLISLHFLAFKHEVAIKDTDIGCSIIHGKNPAFHGPFYNEKMHYDKSKSSKHKLSQKLKDGLKELEELFSNYRHIFLKWRAKEPLLILFSNGIIISIKLNNETFDVEKIVIDNYLCGKLVSEHIVDAVLEEKCLFVSYMEPKVSYIYFSQDVSSISSKILGSKKGKIIGFEPKISTVDLIGPNGRKMERRLSINNLKDCILVWWQRLSDDVVPWTPVNYSFDRISMLVYSIEGAAIEILCSVKISGQLLHAKFSKYHSNLILTLEEIKQSQSLSVNVCNYELARGRCQCTSVMEIPVHSHVVAFDWSLSEDKILLAGEDKSLIIFDIFNNSTLVAATHFIVKCITWHPESTIAVMMSESGQIQCFDFALTCVKLEVLSEVSTTVGILELKSFFLQQFSAQRVMWQSCIGVSKSCDINAFTSDTFLVSFRKGPLVLLRLNLGCITKQELTPLELINQYLKTGGLDEAISLLRRLNWTHNAELCFNCLTAILNYFLRRTLNLKSETMLEHGLGTFYGLCESLPPAVLDEYLIPVNQLARRFFHRLLRFHRFEKAFLLAVDLESRDLFLDLHHVAKQKGETMLAIVALKRAEELLTSESSSSESEETASLSSSTESDCGESVRDEQNTKFEVLPYSHNKSDIPSSILTQHGNPMPPLYSNATLFSSAYDYTKSFVLISEKGDIPNKTFSSQKPNFCNSGKHDVLNASSSYTSRGINVVDERPVSEQFSSETVNYSSHTSKPTEVLGYKSEHRAARRSGILNPSTPVASSLAAFGHNFFKNETFPHHKAEPVNEELDKLDFKSSYSLPSTLNELLQSRGGVKSSRTAPFAAQAHHLGPSKSSRVQEANKELYDDDDDDDVEGARVKFVHFGVV